MLNESKGSLSTSLSKYHSVLLHVARTRPPAEDVHSGTAGLCAMRAFGGHSCRDRTAEFKALAERLGREVGVLAARLVRECECRQVGAEFLFCAAGRREHVRCPG